MTTVIAEIGSTHDGSFGNAVRLIQTAAQVGADAVKLQLHISDAETTPAAPTPPHFSDEERGPYFDRISFTAPQWRDLRSVAADAGLLFFCSPFSIEALEILESIGIDGYKIASGEVTNLPLVERIAQTSMPTFISSGMTNWDELDVAVGTFSNEAQLTILQCSSLYPCPPQFVGLNVLEEMLERYGRPVGFSDHSIGLAAPLAAISKGATVIEKHLTFSRLMYGSDAPFATEPAELAQLIGEIRALDLMIAAPVDKDLIDPYESVRFAFQKSIVAARDLPSGTRLSAHDLASKKPGLGTPPSKYRDLLGRTLQRSLKRDEVIDQDDLD